jgi:hypothetical protein
MGTELADGCVLWLSRYFRKMVITHTLLWLSLSSFVDEFDVLSVRFEAKLIRQKPPETDCVVC